MEKIKSTVFLILISLVGFSQPFSLKDSNVVTGQLAHIYDIYFDLGSPELQKRDQVQLDSLVNFLKYNETLKIEIGVHTDFRGDDNANLILSKKRATAIHNYLTSKGIASSRINVIGFGETRPVIEYEDWKKLLNSHRCGYYGRTNRRITVVIL